MAASCRPIRIDPLPNGGIRVEFEDGSGQDYPDPAGDVRMMIDGNVAFAQLWAVALHLQGKNVVGKLVTIDASNQNPVRMQ